MENGSDEADYICPLCMEEMDLTDRRFQPCQCGYQICLWCWHQIMEMAGKNNSDGRCPACRTPYDKEKIVSASPDPEELTELNNEKKHKMQKQKSRAADGRRHLSNVRVVQRNLVYVVGLPLSIGDEEMLERKEYFGQYGKIMKIAVSRATAHNAPHSVNGPTASVYVTFFKEEDALKCIQAIDGCTLEGKILRACFGTTKYCNAWLKNLPCNNPDCLYLHDIGTQEDSFTKEEMLAKYGSSKHQTFHDLTHPSARRVATVNGLPPPLDAVVSVPAAPIPTASSIAPSHGQQLAQAQGQAAAQASSAAKLAAATATAVRTSGLPPAASWGAKASAAAKTAASATQVPAVPGPMKPRPSALAGPGPPAVAAGGTVTGGMVCTGPATAPIAVPQPLYRPSAAVLSGRVIQASAHPPPIVPLLNISSSPGSPVITSAPTKIQLTGLTFGGGAGLEVSKQGHGDGAAAPAAATAVGAGAGVSASVKSIANDAAAKQAAAVTAQQPGKVRTRQVVVAHGVPPGMSSASGASGGASTVAHSLVTGSTSASVGGKSSSWQGPNGSAWSAVASAPPPGTVSASPALAPSAATDPGAAGSSKLAFGTVAAGGSGSVEATPASEDGMASTSSSSLSGKTPKPSSFAAVASAGAARSAAAAAMRGLHPPGFSQPKATAAEDAQPLRAGEATTRSGEGALVSAAESARGTENKPLGEASSRQDSEAQVLPDRVGGGSVDKAGTGGDAGTEGYGVAGDSSGRRVVAADKDGAAGERVTDTNIQQQDESGHARNGSIAGSRPSSGGQSTERSEWVGSTLAAGIDGKEWQVPSTVVDSGRSEESEAVECSKGEVLQDDLARQVATQPLVLEQGCRAAVETPVASEAAVTGSKGDENIQPFILRSSEVHSQGVAMSSSWGAGSVGVMAGLGKDWSAADHRSIAEAFGRSKEFGKDVSKEGEADISTFEEREFNVIEDILGMDFDMWEDGAFNAPGDLAKLLFSTGGSNGRLMSQSGSGMDRPVGSGPSSLPGRSGAPLRQSRFQFARQVEEVEAEEEKQDKDPVSASSGSRFKLSDPGPVKNGYHANAETATETRDEYQSGKAGGAILAALNESASRAEGKRWQRETLGTFSNGPIFGGQLAISSGISTGVSPAPGVAAAAAVSGLTAPPGFSAPVLAPAMPAASMPSVPAGFGIPPGFSKPLGSLSEPKPQPAFGASQGSRGSTAQVPALPSEPAQEQSSETGPLELDFVDPAIMAMGRGLPESRASGLSSVSPALQNSALGSLFGARGPPGGNMLGNSNGGFPPGGLFQQQGLANRLVAGPQGFGLPLASRGYPAAPHMPAGFGVFPTPFPRAGPQQPEQPLFNGLHVFGQAPAGQQAPAQPLSSQQLPGQQLSDAALHAQLSAQAASSRQHFGPQPPAVGRRPTLQSFNPGVAAANLPGGLPFFRGVLPGQAVNRGFGFGVPENHLGGVPTGLALNPYGAGPAKVAVNPGSSYAGSMAQPVGMFSDKPAGLTSDPATMQGQDQFGGARPGVGGSHSHARAMNGPILAGLGDAPGAGQPWNHAVVEAGLGREAGAGEKVVASAPTSRVTSPLLGSLAAAGRAYTPEVRAGEKVVMQRSSGPVKQLFRDAENTVGTSSTMGDQNAGNVLRGHGKHGSSRSGHGHEADNGENANQGPANGCPGSGEGAPEGDGLHLTAEQKRELKKKERQLRREREKLERERALAEQRARAGRREVGAPAAVAGAASTAAGRKGEKAREDGEGEDKVSQEKLRRVQDKRSGKAGTTAEVNGSGLQTREDGKLEARGATLEKGKDSAKAALPAPSTNGLKAGKTGSLSAGLTAKGKPSEATKSTVVTSPLAKKSSSGSSHLTRAADPSGLSDVLPQSDGAESANVERADVEREVECKGGGVAGKESRKEPVQPVSKAAPCTDQKSDSQEARVTRKLEGTEAPIASLERTAKGSEGDEKPVSGAPWRKSQKEKQGAVADTEQAEAASEQEGEAGGDPATKQKGSTTLLDQGFREGLSLSRLLQQQLEQELQMRQEEGRGKRSRPGIGSPVPTPGGNFALPAAAARAAARVFQMAADMAKDDDTIRQGITGFGLVAMGGLRGSHETDIPELNRVLEAASSAERAVAAAAAWEESLRAQRSSQEGTEPSMNFLLGTEGFFKHSPRLSQVECLEREVASAREVEKALESRLMEVKEWIDHDNALLEGIAASASVNTKMTKGGH